MKPIYKYLSTKITNSKIRANDDAIKKIVKDELDRLGHDADLNHIDVSEVTDMHALFSCYKYDYLGSKYKDLNPDISLWDVSNVINMKQMFYLCKNFNSDISGWNVSKVEDMHSMFSWCEKFNQDISGWDVSKCEDMEFMFNECKKFNKDISNWDVSEAISYESIFKECPIKKEYKPKFK